MTHWLYPVIPPEAGEPAGSLDEAVDRFDVDHLLADFEATGAGWLIFTLGQNTGYYAGPNPVIEELAGPGHCARRDLPLEIARGASHGPAFHRLPALRSRGQHVTARRVSPGTRRKAPPSPSSSSATPTR